MNLNLLTPRGFLLIGGTILVILGLAGMVFLGPTMEASLLGEFFWLDNTENIAHLVLGVVALGAYYFLKDDKMLKYLVGAVGVVGVVVAVLGFMNMGAAIPNVGVAHLENPSDNVLHLVVGAWALWVSFGKMMAKGK